MISSKKVCVVLVNYNGTKDTLECINSILATEYNNYAIVVVDNNSTDNSVEVLRKIQENKLVIIENSENAGFAGGNNIGIRYSIDNGADYICLLNNDTIVERNFFNKIIESFEIDEKIGVVCPMIKEYYKPEKISYGGGSINYLKGGVYINGINDYDIDIMNTSRKISFGSGCCFCIKKEVIETVGYMPEDYFLYYEDTDYSLKCIKKGWDIFYNADFFILHKESASTKKDSPNYQYYFVRNRLMFIRNNLSLYQKITAYPATCMYVVKKLIGHRFQIVNVLEAVFDFIRKKTGKRKQ